MSALDGLSLVRAFLHEGGALQPPKAKHFPVEDPATGEIVGYAPDQGVLDARKAIQNAYDAKPGWAAKTARERAVVLRRWHDLIIDRQEDLARLVTAEMGKPIAEARGEILYGAGFIEWFAEEAKRIYGDIIPGHQPDKRIFVLKQPVGVVAAITPWNFPVAMITRKVAPALAAGCTAVVKPADATALSALALAELADAAGVPKDVFSVVTGTDAAALGKEFCDNELVRKISFTGSTGIGRLLMAQSAHGLKKLSLELGGNAPFIVFDDADVAVAVEGAVQSKFRNAGQTCVCANRLYVQAGIHDEFVSALEARVAQMSVGAGVDPGTDIGPLINTRALGKVEDHIADAVENGARIAIGGNRHPHGECFFAPTILTGVTGQMRIAKEETFGPVAPVFRFSSEDDVIVQANATEFGLASYVFTTDLARAHRVAERLEAGIVGLNTGLISTPEAPFGGIKQSGFGREGSKYGIEEYLETKYVCLAGV